MPRKYLFQLFFLLAIIAAEDTPVLAQAPFFKNIVYDIEKKGTRLLTIFQEKKGPLWLGTSLGMCRYDGINFKYLDKDSNQVSAIGESNDGVLWMGHINGAIEYAKDLGVRKFSPPDMLPKTKITAILFDKENRLWFSTYGEGVYCYENNRMHIFNAKNGLSDNVVYDLLLSEDNTVWAATDLGISVCTLNNSSNKIAIIDTKTGLPDNIVRSLRQDAAGNIWVGLQDKGVCYIDKVSGKIIVPQETLNWPYGQVNDILPMKREVFIATEEYGIIEIHYGLPLLNRMVPAKGKKMSAVQQLLLDKNEQVWVVADNTLSVANSNHFQVIEIPPVWQEAVKAITTDSTGKIWFANRKGIFSKDNNNTPVEQVKSIKDIDYASIVCLYSDKNNRLWIGTYNNGLYRYTPATRQLIHYTSADGMVDNNVFSIAGIGDEIWLGTLGGAAKLDASQATPRFQNFTRQNGLSNNFIYNVAIDANDSKWFATDGNGISKLDKDGFHHYDNIPGLEKNIVYTTTEDIYGNTWFNGLNSGLFCYDGKTFKRYSIKNGLHDNEILNVVADNKGNLLLSHPDGLELFNIRRELFTFYGAESGFDNIRPQINAWCRTPKGGILIGSAEKIIQYFPSDTRYTQLPQLVMNNVLVYFKPIGTADNTRFTYDENHITFDYAGLWYIHPEAISYQYQLEGYSNDWINTRDHSITFPNLRPGGYVFRVKASINEDYRYSPLLTYRFSIAKPFWKTTWFVLLLLLVTAVIIYYFVRLRIQFIHFEQQKEKQKLTAQLAMLKSQLNPHFLFNSFNTLINIIDKDKQMAMEFAEKLSDFYREVALLQDREMIPVQEELNLLQNYIYLQQKRFGNTLQLQLNISNPHLQAGIPPLTLQLLAENAIKHNSITEEKPLIISIESAQSFLVVSNNISKQEVAAKSAGLGLNNIQQRVQMLTGQEVKILATDHEFNVIIPLKQ
jgi:ligand-binding sensor domain-containing protein